MTAPQEGKPGFYSVTVVQLGARMHYAVPEILVRNGMLTQFHTDVVAPRINGSQLGNSLQLLQFLRVAKRYLGRVISTELRKLTRQHRALGWWYALRLKSVRTTHARRALFLAQAQAFGNAVARSGFGRADAVYTFTSVSLEVLERARADGVHGILEQFVAAQPFLDDLLAEERAAFADWELVGETGVLDLAYRDRLRREWALADTIICPSSFVANSLVHEGVDPEKLVVVPYGVAAPTSLPAPRQSIGPLRILFVGTVELRKGVHYLTEALGRLDSACYQAKVAGPVRLSPAGADRLSAVAEVLGQVPRSEVGALFDWADVLVLPSLVEGSATVTYEALVRGVPVVCTPNAGSIVVDGETGLLVAMRSVDDLASALSRLSSEPLLLDTLRKTAMARRDEAAIDRYEANLLRALRQRLAIGAED